MELVRRYDDDRWVRSGEYKYNVSFWISSWPYTWNTVEPHMMHLFIYLFIYLFICGFPKGWCIASTYQGGLPACTYVLIQ